MWIYRPIPCIRCSGRDGLRPTLALEKTARGCVPLPLDADIIDWFQRQGQGYQTRMNSALREYVKRHCGRA